MKIQGMHKGRIINIFLFLFNHPFSGDKKRLYSSCEMEKTFKIRKILKYHKIFKYVSYHIFIHPYTIGKEIIAKSLTGSKLKIVENVT